MKAIFKMVRSLLWPEKMEKSLDRQLETIRREREEAERLLKQAQATLDGEEGWFRQLKEQQQQENRRP